MNGETGTLSALPSVKKVHLSYKQINKVYIVSKIDVFM